MKRIVVGIDGSKVSFESYRRSVNYFPREEIFLEAVFVIDERKLQIPFIYSGAAYDIAYERIYIPLSKDTIALNEQIKKNITEFGNRCLDICKSFNFERDMKQEFVLLNGIPSEELLNYSKNSDLIVIGQHGENGSSGRETVGSTAEELIRSSLKPVLVIPDKPVVSGSVLIIYEGGLSSEKALDFYENNLTKTGGKLILLNSSGNNKNYILIDKKLKILSDRGVEVEIKEVKGHIVKKVMEITETDPVEVIITGAHSSHKISEYLLGSETAHIIRKSSVPVFVIH